MFASTCSLTPAKLVARPHGCDRLMEQFRSALRDPCQMHASCESTIEMQKLDLQTWTSHLRARCSLRSDGGEERQEEVARLNKIRSFMAWLFLTLCCVKTGGLGALLGVQLVPESNQNGQQLRRAPGTLGTWGPLLAPRASSFGRSIPKQDQFHGHVSPARNSLSSFPSASTSHMVKTLDRARCCS